MSTYTDLKNVVKETVTVNYDDRYTNQKVKLFNEENEFWGTYHGTLAGDATLKGMGIDSAKIENSTLKNVEISGCPQLDALSGMLSALKAGTAATTSYISAVVDANKSELEQKIDQIDTDYDKVRRYAQLITDLSDSVDAKVSALGQGIKTNAEDILAMGLAEKADYRALSGLVGRTAGDLSAQVSVELLSANTRIDELLLSCQSNLDTVEGCVKLANDVDDRRAIGDYNLSIWVHEIQNYVETVLSNATELSNLDTVMERLDEVTAIVDSAVSTVYDLSAEMAEYAGEIEGISSMAGMFDTRIDHCNSAIHVMNDTFNLFAVNMGTMLSSLVKRMDDFAADGAKQEDLELSVGNLVSCDSYISGVIDQKAFLSDLLTAAVEGDSTKTTIGLKPDLSVDVLTQHQDITGKQDTISDLADIRAGAADGKEAVSRDVIAVESSSVVKAYATAEATVKTWSGQTGFNTPYQNVFSGNCFKLDMQSFCGELLKTANVTGVPLQVRLDMIALTTTGYNGSARLMITKSGETAAFAESNVANVTSGSQTIFEFLDAEWQDAKGEYEFKLFNADGTAQITGTGIRYGSQHISVKGFAIGNNGGSYTAKAGCYAGSTSAYIRYYDAVKLATSATTLSGYGITDAKIENSNKITLGTSSITLGALATKSSVISSDINGNIPTSKIAGLGNLASKDSLVSSDIPAIDTSKVSGLGSFATKSSLVSSDIPTINTSKVSGLGSFATKSSLLSSEIPALNSTKISDLGTLANKSSITSGDISGSLKLAQLGGVAAALAPFKGLVYDDGYDVDIETVISALVQLANLT